MKGAGVMSSFLGPVMWYCADRGLPPLTVLVVNQESGVPGDGFTTLHGALNEAREAVFRFDWFSLVPPQAADFEEAERKPDRQ